MAFEFEDSRRKDVLAYLRKREGGFSEVAIELALPADERVPATMFVYARKNIIATKTDDDIARMVLRARGTDGAALEYVRNCKANLNLVGIADPAVDKLLLPSNGCGANGSTASTKNCCFRVISF